MESRKGRVLSPQKLPQLIVCVQLLDRVQSLSTFLLLLTHLSPLCSLCSSHTGLLARPQAHQAIWPQGLCISCSCCLESFSQIFTWLDLCPLCVWAQMTPSERKGPPPAPRVKKSSSDSPHCLAYFLFSTYGNLNGSCFIYLLPYFLSPLLDLKFPIGKDFCLSCLPLSSGWHVEGSH